MFTAVWPAAQAREVVSCEFTVWAWRTGFGRPPETNPHFFFGGDFRGARTQPLAPQKQFKTNHSLSDMRWLQVKVTPWQASARAECRWRYDYNPFATSALEGGEWSAARPGRFTPGTDLVRTVLESGWTPRQVWTGAEYLAPHRDSIPRPSSA